MNSSLNTNAGSLVVATNSNMAIQASSEHAPIAVFCYRRPDHLRRTLESLMRCDGFDSSRAGACNWALNLPIAEVGIMAWFDGDYVLKETANGQGLGYLAPDWKGEYQIITSVAIDRPTIVKINIPHQVINHSDKRRLVLSMRFYPDIY